MPLVAVTFFVMLAFGLALATAVLGQSSGSQRYTVEVISNATVTAPPNVVVSQQIAESDEVFPLQTWVVRGNAIHGIVVDFAIHQPFIHLNDDAFKSDAELNLSIGDRRGAATWTVTQASDSTDLSEDDETALVQAMSDGAGVANLELEVRFLVDPLATLAPGEYETTVTSTISIP